MPRFVLLRHECPAGYEKPGHWDFMLEWPEGLRTWELRELPALWRTALGADMPASTGPASTGPASTGLESTGLESTGPTTESVRARRLADHRHAYLDYEGPVSHNRGSVSRRDRGTYRVIRETSGRLEIKLAGDRLQADVILELEAEGGINWCLWIEKKDSRPVVRK